MRQTRKERRASCSSVTCILVGVRSRKTRCAADFRGPLAKKAPGYERSGGGAKKRSRTDGKIQNLLLNGVGVPASGGVSFKNIPPDTPPVLVLSLPLVPRAHRRAVRLHREPVSGKAFSDLVPRGTCSTCTVCDCKSHRKASTGIKEHASTSDT